MFLSFLLMKEVDLMVAWNQEFAEMVRGETNGHYLLANRG